MTNETVEKTLRALLELRSIDRELARLERRCQECPALIEKHRREFETENELLAQKTKSLGDVRIKMRQMEMELRSREQQIEKLSRQLLTARTNQEYAAFQDQIKRLMGEKGEFETNILVSMDRLEEQEKRLRQADAEAKIRAKEFAETRAALENDLKEYSRDAQQLQQQRTEKAYELPPEALRAYERVLRALGGDGIVPMENRICSGCYMAITNNDYVKICAMREIVHCKSCQRILYSPDHLLAEP